MYRCEKPVMLFLLSSLLFVIVFPNKSLGKKNGGNSCTHGGILNGVFLHGGIRSRNDTLFSGVSSMEDCIAKCCKVNKCDLAMKIGHVCHAVRCQDDDSCQISHKSDGTTLRAEISFITKGEEVKSEPKQKKKQPNIKKKPTTPLLRTLPKTTTKVATTLPKTTTKAATTLPITTTKAATTLPKTTTKVATTLPETTIKVATSFPKATTKVSTKTTSKARPTIWRTQPSFPELIPTGKQSKITMKEDEDFRPKKGSKENKAPPKKGEKNMLPTEAAKESKRPVSKSGVLQFRPTTGARVMQTPLITAGVAEQEHSGSEARKDDAEEGSGLDGSASGSGSTGDDGDDEDDILGTFGSEDSAGCKTSGCSSKGDNKGSSRPKGTAVRLAPKMAKNAKINEQIKLAMSMAIEGPVNVPINAQMNGPINEPINKPKVLAKFAKPEAPSSGRSGIPNPFQAIDTDGDSVMASLKSYSEDDDDPSDDSDDGSLAGKSETKATSDGNSKNEVEAENDQNLKSEVETKSDIEADSDVTDDDSGGSTVGDGGSSVGDGGSSAGDGGSSGEKRVAIGDFSGEKSLTHGVSGQNELNQNSRITSAGKLGDNENSGQEESRLLPKPQNVKDKSVVAKLKDVIDTLTETGSQVDEINNIRPIDKSFTVSSAAKKSDELQPLKSSIATAISDYKDSDLNVDVSSNTNKDSIHVKSQANVKSFSKEGDKVLGRLTINGPKRHELQELRTSQGKAFEVVSKDNLKENGLKNGVVKADFRDAKAEDKISTDFNDVARGIISSSPTKKHTKATENDGENPNDESSDKKQSDFLKKTNVKAKPWQQQLSNLFAKDSGSHKLERKTLQKSSKQKSIEKLRRIQKERDKKRNHKKSNKDGSSLSVLYSKSSGKSNVRYLIHRFSDWRGWKRDQILNLPQHMKCRRGVTIHGATLRGGILAGDFKTIGIVSNQHSCVNSCCRNKRCDVALMLGKECFNVKCYSDSLCGLAPATSIFDEVTPIITYVRGRIRRKRSSDDEEEEEITTTPEDENLQLLKWLKIFI